MEHLYPRTCYPLFTPLSAYIYDASRNQFVPVSKSLFFELVRAHNCQTLQNREEFEALLEEGFLAPHTIKSVVHPFTKYIDLMLGRTMSQILLQVTQDCNFRCEYCVYTASIDGVQRKHQNKHMSWDTAKRAVDYLWEHSIDSDVITIGFYGGEPLLEYSLIQKVISYSDKRFAGKQIHYAMTTNASLLSIEKARYLYDHHVHLILSIDGPAEIHNANRPFKNSNCGSYSVVLNNITQLKKELPEYINEIELNMVIDPQSNLDEIYSILNEGGDFYGFKAMATIINDLSLKKKNNRTQDFSIQLEYQTFLLLLKELI